MKQTASNSSNESLKTKIKETKFTEVPYACFLN